MDVKTTFCENTSRKKYERVNGKIWDEKWLLFFVRPAYYSRIRKEKKEERLPLRRSKQQLMGGKGKNEGGPEKRIPNAASSLPPPFLWN